MARCFYCTHQIDHKRLRTADHVYPRRLKIKGKDVAWHDLNKVPCCHGCNGIKGGLHPLDWLVIMPSNERAKAMAELLVKLGEDMQQVFDAMRRRKR